MNGTNQGPLLRILLLVPLSVLRVHRLHTVIGRAKRYERTKRTDSNQSKGRFLFVQPAQPQGPLTEILAFHSAHAAENKLPPDLSGLKNANAKRRVL